MANGSSVDAPPSLVAAGVDCYRLFQHVQRLRARVTHPEMEDPGKDLVHRLQWPAVVLDAVVVIAAVALFASLGPVAIIPVAVCVLIAIVSGIVTAVRLWLMMEQQRRTCRYVICEAHYADARPQIKSTMRRIYRSADSVRSSATCQQKTFGGLGLDHLVYSAAERAILSSELSARVRDLRPNADQALLEEVNEQIRAIQQELATVEATLQRDRAVTPMPRPAGGRPEKARMST